MPKTTQKPVVKELQPLDVEILKNLYNYRALSTGQVSEFHGMSMPYTYRKLNILRNTGYIRSEPIRGYIRGQSRQGNYHRISEAGIACLRKQGYPAERRADDLRVRRFHLPFVLTTNNILIKLEQAGWTVQDSRDVKKQYRLNRSTNVQGRVTTPDGMAFVIYTFLHSTSAKNLQKIIREMEQHRFFDTYAFFTKGQESFSQVVDRLMDSRVITECKSLKVFPQTFGINYLLAFRANEEQVIRELAYRGILHVPASETDNTARGHPDGLSQIVRYQGEEMYFLNLLDTDLIKIKHILQYRKDRYERNGRKVLVLTHPGLRPKHESLLQHVHHVHFLEVGGEILEPVLRNK
ncbi:replication-relaxation family protein [Virgibacillus xinjiangensis]|uniref:Replication-relaxation family protein n=1 Tax=Virgibacillus xinjiangensis TaxID=393090 RepID=A0ABV7CYZ8_9BACI